MNKYDNIFNQDFYPTPKEVVERMLALSDVAGKVILEPSAGTGNIVDFLKECHAKEVIAFEINSKFQAILQHKCRLVADDFLRLTAEQISHVDLIVMNPPFSEQEKHIRHAWEIAPDGCEIVSLCNSNMLNKGYSMSSERRALNELIDLYGGSEELGDVFSTSEERKTDVWVSVVRMYKPKTGDLEFDEYFDLTPDEEDTLQQQDGLMSYNFVRDCVNRYKTAVSMFDEAMARNNAINALTKEIGGQGIIFGAFMAGGSSYSEQNKIVTHDQFKKELQKKAWRWIFDKFEMHKYMTASVMADINKFVETQKQVPFTMKNIYKMIEMVIATHGSRVDRIILESFDKICSFAPENSTAIETWKTNSSHMVNKRFIVPYICKGYHAYDGRSYDFVEVDKWGGGATAINDLVRALCYLTGKNYDDMPHDLGRMCGFLQWGQWHDWGFFRIRGYKKGTMHFEFVREEDWWMFNQKVASMRGWELPQQTAKKTHRNEWKKTEA